VICPEWRDREISEIGGSRMKNFQIAAEVWQYPGAGGWHFVTLPEEVSAELRFLARDSTKPWGSVKIVATLGTSNWSTSLFPDKKSGRYLLPLKSEIRKKENIGAGTTVKFEIAVST